MRRTMRMGTCLMERCLAEGLRRSDASKQLFAQYGPRADIGRNGEFGAFMLCLHNSPGRGTQPVSFRFQQFIETQSHGGARSHSGLRTGRERPRSIGMV